MPGRRIFESRQQRKNAILSDGREVKEGTAYWVKVEPIEWLVDTNNDFIISKQILFAGISFDNRFDELKRLSMKFKEDYLKKRKVENTESSFFNQIKLFENTLDIKIPDNFQYVELEFIKIFRKEKLIEGVKELFNYLYSTNHKIYILTNSIFSGDSLKSYLGTFKIDQYIEKVYSSADIGFRKPSKKAFTYVLEDIGVENLDDIYFIGDSPEKDFKGAQESGITPILYGTTSNVKGLMFNDLNSILNFFKKIEHKLFVR